MADPAAAVLKALADGNRRRILTVIRDGDRPVGDIAREVGMSQQAVSHHLSVLEGAGLVVQRRDRTRHLFRVRTEGLEVARQLVEGFWPARLRALKEVAERHA